MVGGSFAVMNIVMFVVLACWVVWLVSKLVVQKRSGASSRDDRLWQAFDDGVDAARQGYPVDVNPYLGDPKRRQAFIDGWYSEWQAGESNDS